jgi:predicted amidohydrolase YtcJ
MQDDHGHGKAIRIHTTNNASIVGLDDQIGSLEPCKLADLIVVDRDLLTCSIDGIKDTKVVTTCISGKQIYPQP